VPGTGGKASSRDRGEVILSDNAEDAPNSGPTRRKLTPDAIDTNITPEESLSLTRGCGAGREQPLVFVSRPAAVTALLNI
jgi:hypothetical protein